MQTGRLAGKIALITGAGSGMGNATAHAMAQEGATVYATDISIEKLDAEYADTNITALQLDISDSAAVKEVFAQVAADHGKLDILVNAAGVAMPTRESTQRVDAINHAMVEAMQKGEVYNPEFFGGITDDEFDRAMRINLYGTFYMIREAIPLLKAAGGGAITNFASIAGLVALPMPAYYPASKAAVVGMTRAAAGELAPFNIRVNALAPAGINTAMLKGSGEDHANALLMMQPLKRFAEPEEIAQTLIFLSSNDGAHYTGQILSPSGGAYLA
ncbi:SDR family NAD(P)-dependent oxidoreductase [Corynebacterium crudilactis]|uniref:Short-chain dehydrogenase n=1 Tax=Corynebacterium crudilactis TaxID=1652495 RepID=A0A172QQU0_9CORY|nr:SDR family NAD(P)-dependent oxidoreductase [Corynebacterium crudilactis]ANE03042.1 short-chain dehydrogenase [Corynebacterium crudilactis]